MRVMAVDPGKVSGYAIWLPGEAQSFWSGEMSHLDFLDWAMPRILEKRFDSVACESFVITMATLQKSRGENWSLESIGALRWACHRSGTEFALQTPADAKKFSTDSKLKTVDFYTPGKGHANDAARHLLLLMVRKKMFDPVVFAR